MLRPLTKKKEIKREWVSFERASKNKPMTTTRTQHSKAYDLTQKS